MSDTTPTRRQVLRASGVLGAAGIAGCTGLTDAAGDDDIADTDGDGVINTEDYAPWDEDVQEKSQLVDDESASAEPTSTETATDTETATPARAAVQYTFESGLEGWVPIWEGPNSCADTPGLQHETGSNVIEGSGSALFTTECDSNKVASPTFDVDTSRDFTISVDFSFEDSDSRGLALSLYGSDQNGSPDDRIRAGQYSHQFVRARRRPADDEQLVVAVDTETEVPQGTIDPNTRHTLVGRKRGGSVSVTLDGQQYTDGAVSQASWNTGETYRVMLRSSGAWGAPSRVWFDSLSVSYP